MNYAYLLAIAFLLLCGWRAWNILAAAHPFARAAGTVLSVILPVPVFLVIVLYHYAARRSPASAGRAASA
jgi:hypothetical protein